MSVEADLKYKILKLKLVYRDLDVQCMRNARKLIKLNRYRYGKPDSKWAKNEHKRTMHEGTHISRNMLIIQNEIKVAGDTICRLREIRRGNSKRTVESVLLQYSKGV